MTTPESAHQEQQPSVKPVEVSRDEHRNIWFTFNDEPQRTSFLDGTVPSQAVITEEGRRLIPKDEQRALMERVKKDTIVRSIRALGKGGEAVVRKVTNAKNRVADLLGMHTLQAVVKEYPNTVDTSLLGWEQVEIYDDARPIFEKLGLQLIKPLGATNDEVFMPLINGVTLNTFLSELDPQSAIFLREKLKEVTNQLHDELYQHMSHVMESKGLQRIRKGDQKRDTDSDWFSRPDNPKDKIMMQIDIHDGGAHSRDRYDNWMIPHDAIKEIMEGDGVTALKLLKKHMVAIDPFFIVSRPPDWTPMAAVGLIKTKPKFTVVEPKKST